MDLWELVARESIRDLVARYNANGDSGRFDHVLECFAPDAVMEIDGEVYRGRPHIRTIFTNAAEAARRWPEPLIMRHHTSTLQIDLAGPNEASSRCYYQVVTAKGLDHWGRYLDDYTVVDGVWYFARRREFLDGSVPDSWAAFAMAQR
ncbi:MAG: nuclear transport factor 2 family protein [Acidimicrobiales bacterium]